MNRLKDQIVRRLGDYSLRKGGTEYIFSCVWCGRKKLEVNFNKGRFNCLRCKEGGSVRWLAKRLKLGGADLRHQVASEIFNKAFYSEIKSKEISIPGYDGSLYYNSEISRYIKERGVDIYRACRLGWGSTSDINLYGRLIIPIFEQGKIVCYVARSVNGCLPKEICPPSTVVNRSHFLYNLDEIREGDRVILVEGIFGCEAVLKMGHKCVASMGSNLSDVQVGKLVATRPRSINIMYDGDLAGRKGATEAFSKIFKRFSKGVYIVKLPDGKQPDTLTSEEWRELRFI